MKPLENVVVLDLTRVLSGPYAAMMLADMGANVIHIEQPKIGDDSRAYGPFIGKESAYFMSLNRNKRSMTMNFKSEEAKAVFKEMVKKADVVVENFKPGTMKKFGLDYSVLKEINPKIIYASCSGFGQTGPYTMKPAYDVVVQAMGGIMSITGPDKDTFCRVGASVGDIIAGIFLATGITTALYKREVSGIGQEIDVSMLDCQVAILENAVSRYFVNGVNPTPLGNRHSSITPFESFTASDGLLIVGAGNDRLWKKLCDLINKPELIEDPRFITNADRTNNEPALKEILDAVFVTDTIEHWLEKLEAAAIPCAPINTIDKVVNDPQVNFREMIVEVEHPTAGKMKIPGVPIKFSETPCGVEKAAPVLGQHTDEVLKEFGFDDAEIAKLHEVAAV